MLTYRDEAIDGASARGLLGAFELEIAGLYPGWSPTSGPSAAPEEFVPPGGLFLVGYDGAEAVACGGYKRLDDMGAEVKRMFVVPASRGIDEAGRLLDELERRARLIGYARLRLDTGDAQPAALHLYLSHGYVEIDDYNGNPHASYWLEKSLTGD